MRMFEIETIGDCTLYRGDCMEVLPTLGKICAILTDPPYGIGRDKGMGRGGKGKNNAPRRCVKIYQGDWDFERPPPEVFWLIQRISGNQIIWGGQFFADLLPARGKWLWWDKLQTMPSYGAGEMAWTSLDGDAIRKFELGLNGIIARGETGLHPTQKPVALMRWCLQQLPSDVRTVCDPFMGSGTTGVACVKEGKNFIGIDRERRYFDIACKRVEDAYRQPDMFIAPPKPMEQTSLMLEPHP